ncbi:uncharacterized protein BT62DRAFT_369696 [Guyanagaster necrorhizus]|uniref:Uncharacterized protein n=1 Tax=Guyanagaster necrorhizus TaxID=856835 RepID=A0A9P7VL35_9AGAR|nr:uncharacterized protein BT62DRAFT_369696 [Guyanagaster necrorhizus MCA 3950]KAG7442689.1 hypothetical protein BT62DRAFT_369696 [Guyanagaster necrorhizus MCA 3950]
MFVHSSSTTMSFLPMSEMSALHTWGLPAALHTLLCWTNSRLQMGHKTDKVTSSHKNCSRRRSVYLDHLLSIISRPLWNYFCRKGETIYVVRSILGKEAKAPRCHTLLPSVQEFRTCR